jgi:hypothetical protein
VRLRSVAGAIAVTFLVATACKAGPVVVPFDFSRHEIGLTVRVHGTPLYMFLDTGVSPSAIDTARAKSLGLKIDFGGGGEASGAGDAAHVIVYPTSIDDVVLGGRHFGAVEALTADHTAISKAYGRTVDGTLGHSFLSGRVMLIDYAARTLSISGRETDLTSQLATCRRAWRLPLRSFKGDKIPIVELGVGKVRLPASIDTGADGTVELFQHALDVPAVKTALMKSGTHKTTGMRGEYLATIYKLNAPISLGPFVLPAGQTVTLSDAAGSAKTRMANVGNKLLAGMHLKLLLDYRDNRIAFLGACSRRP